MKDLDLIILYYIYKNKNDDGYCWFMGTENNWRTIFTEKTYKSEDLPFVPSFKLYLKQFFEDIEISNERIHDSLLFLKDSAYIDNWEFDRFSFKLTDKGQWYIYNNDIPHRDNIKKRKLGF